MHRYAEVTDAVSSFVLILLKNLPIFLQMHSILDVFDRCLNTLLIFDIFNVYI